ncbi:protein NRT1/ PTR FAMILY 8.1-like [Salvia splendens]|uniref:protein NRT1/ PTR FAMILY 8.1-like n=1 Tax=Salvia splendens TaxID=180675 RepID=UPI001C26F9E8|nr:protein NRT1/ PTR FAMILY 8.1-like [Salvia splendens]
MGTCYIMPFFGAFVADAFLGRYYTIARFSIIYVIIQGMALLTLSASVTGPRPACHRKDDCHATTVQSTVCFISLYSIALGTGGLKPFGADQFEEVHEVEKKHKSSFFNWFYFSINIGALIGSSVLVWVQMNIGWEWGFGLPTLAMAIAVGFFFLRHSSVP